MRRATRNSVPSGFFLASAGASSIRPVIEPPDAAAGAGSAASGAGGGGGGGGGGGNGGGATAGGGAACDSGGTGDGAPASSFFEHATIDVIAATTNATALLSRLDMARTLAD
jgi:hypothetical protein